MQFQNVYTSLCNYIGKIQHSLMYNIDLLENGFLHVQISLTNTAFMYIKHTELAF